MTSVASGSPSASWNSAAATMGAPSTGSCGRRGQLVRPGQQHGRHARHGIQQMCASDSTHVARSACKCMHA